MPPVPAPTPPAQTPLPPTQPTLPTPPATPSWDAAAPAGAGRSKKPLLIAISAAVVVVVGVAVGVFMWANAAKSSYALAVPAYTTRAKSSYDYFMKLSDRLEHGSDIKKNIDQTIASKPKAPKLLGKSLAPASDVKRVDDITKALQDFESAYVTASDVSTYSDKTLTIMDKAALSIRTIDDMKAAKTKFQAAKDSLHALAAPAPVSSFHTKTQAAYTTAIADIDTALTAYNAGKTTAYTAAVQKLATDVRDISASTAQKELADIFATAYGKADTAFGKLQDVLGIKP
jgi:hypothetical protein